ARLIGRARWDFAQPEEGDFWRQHRETLNRCEPFRDFVYRIKPETGPEHAICISGKPVFDASGHFQGYRGSGRIITDQVRQQELLRASEERFRDYADTASDWFWESDREHRFTYLSPSDRRPNVRDQTVIGRRRWDYAEDVAEEPEKWAKHRETLERREAVRNFVFRMRNAPADPAISSGSGTTACVAAREYQGYRGSARRINEQARQQALLQESDERFRDLADTASDWFWETEPEHRLSYVSESVSMLRGGDRSVALGRTRWEMAA